MYMQRWLKVPFCAPMIFLQPLNPSLDAALIYANCKWPQEGEIAAKDGYLSHTPFSPATPTAWKALD